MTQQPESIKQYKLITSKIKPLISHENTKSRSVHRNENQSNE